jgi:hypothetical protein
MTTPFLSNLGIDPIVQARSPTPETFPPALNTNNKSVWSTAVAETPSLKNPLEDWARCLKRYIELCEEQDVFPFQTFHESKNDQITDFLRQARQAVVKYINLSKLFDEVKMQTSHRQVQVTHNGFIITVYAKVTVTDPSFEQWLQTMPYPHFNSTRSIDGKWVKPVQSGVTMFVVNGEHGGHMNQRWHIGYEIECPMFPDVPTSGTPSKTELEHFIEEILWMPILRSHRPKKLLRRLV